MSALLESADEIARRVNAPGGELSEHLTAEGWVIPEMRRDRYGVQVEHVFAVGALVAGARLLMLQKKASTLLRDLMKPEFAFKAPDIREALYSTELVIGCCRLAAEAMFISGRVDMRERVMQQEAEVRSERAAHGGRATRKLSDDELSAFCAEWQAKHGRKRGERKAAAAHFGVSDTAIGCRLKKIRTD